MKTGEKGLYLIKAFESLRLNAYICPAGIPTIGYGTTRIDGSAVKMGMTITAEQSDEFLRKDLEKIEDFINVKVLVPLTQNQFDSLVSFVYNLGSGNFQKSTLLKKLNAGDYNGAANEFLKWNKAAGKVLAGLTRRREAEKELFLSTD